MRWGEGVRWDSGGQVRWERRGGGGRKKKSLETYKIINEHKGKSERGRGHGGGYDSMKDLLDQVRSHCLPQRACEEAAV